MEKIDKQLSEEKKEKITQSVKEIHRELKELLGEKQFNMIMGIGNIQNSSILETKNYYSIIRKSQKMKIKEINELIKKINK